LGGCVGRRRQEAREEQQEQQDAAALARENVRLRRNQLEMEKFLADYGLVWVGDQPQASVRHKIGYHRSAGTPTPAINTPTPAAY
jgi:hypothetical protein